MCSARRLFGAASVLAFLPGECAFGLPPGFYPRVPPVPFVGGSARAVSADGSVTAGSYRYSGGGTAGVRWSPAGEERPTGFDQVTAVSADGSTYAGYREAEHRTAVYFSPTTGLIDIGTLAGAEHPGSSSTGVSPDGELALGFSFSARGQEAFEWTALGGLRPLPALESGRTVSTAYAATADRSSIVGFCDDGEGHRHAVRWVRVGSTFIIQRLEDLPGGRIDCSAHAITPDGSIIVGYGSAEDATFATVWIGTLPRSLGDLPGGEHQSRAFAASPDGAIIAGEATDADGPAAFIWTEGYGMQSLSTAIRMAGLMPPTGWKLQRVLGLSADGLTAVGEAVDELGELQGYVVVLPVRPCGGDVNWDGLVDFLDYLAFLNYYGRADLAADYTNDGQIDFGDYLAFLNAYAAGC